MFYLKLICAVGVIVACAALGRRYPSLAGLIATMPLTSLLVLLWLWSDDPADRAVPAKYAQAALFGILPTILFFAVLAWCLRRGVAFPAALAAAFAAWGAGALLHQGMLR